MTFHAQALLSQDSDFINRVSACVAAEQVQAQAPLGAMLPTTWAAQHVWQVAASPGFADSYQYALDTGVSSPGADSAVITDADLLAAVQAELIRWREA